MFHLFVIKGCPYCKAAIDLVKKHKISHKLTWVADDQKDYYKEAHKMHTFPQVFYKTTENSRSANLIGGSSDLEQLVHSLNFIKETGLPQNAIKNLMNDIK